MLRVNDEKQRLLQCHSSDKPGQETKDNKL